MVSLPGDGETIRKTLIGGIQMGIWIFMFIMNLLIPLTMIGIGIVFAKRPPSKINMFFGYKSRMSMKNQDTWTFAHLHCGRLWVAVGRVLLPLSIAAMLFLIGRDENVAETAAGIIMGVQCVVLLTSVIPTEAALRKHFDRDGNRR
jgi:uncharacterized membrane protein